MLKHGCEVAIDQNKLSCYNCRSVMSTGSATTTLSNDERKWVVIGVCLTKVLPPALRNVLATEIPKWYNILCQAPNEIGKQVYSRHQKKLARSTLTLNYKNINNNDAHRSPSACCLYLIFVNGTSPYQ